MKQIGYFSFNMAVGICAKRDESSIEMVDAISFTSILVCVFNQSFIGVIPLINTVTI